MNTNREKTVGILGGMGPEATVDLMQRIIHLTPANDDIDHIRCIIDNNPKVPSRIKAIIEGDGEDPGPCMAEMGRGLEKAGADFLVIACNTAHYYYDAVQSAVNIPVIHLIRLVTDYLTQKFSDHKSIGILASPAVSITGLYTRQFEAKKLNEIWPEKDMQDILLGVIRSVKKGNTGEEVVQNYRKVCQNLSNQGANLAVVACTELSALNAELPLPIVDAAEILAEEIVNIAKNRTSLVDY